MRFSAVFAAALLCAGNALAAPTILVWGDSLSAGYGLDAKRGWVALLDQKLKSQALDYAVVNASVSGETTSGGVARLPAALDRYHPSVVLIELGGNDGLRALPVEKMRANLETMIAAARGAGAQPVLFAMRIPSNYGPAYTERFKQTFDDLAATKKTPLVPFFLGAIAADIPRWFQDDGLHPNASAQPQLLDAVWPTLAPLLKAAPASRTHTLP